MRLNKKDGLNIVPFIDIMLVLLAIVLSPRARSRSIYQALKAHSRIKRMRKK